MDCYNRLDRIYRGNGKDKMIRESDLLLTFNIKDDVEQCYDIDCEISHLGLFLNYGKFYSAGSSASGCHLPDGTFWMDLPDGTGVLTLFV